MRRTFWRIQCGYVDFNFEDVTETEQARFCIQKTMINKIEAFRIKSREEITSISDAGNLRESNYLAPRAGIMMLTSRISKRQNSPDSAFKGSIRS